MKVSPLAIPDVFLIEPAVWPDARGYFFEAFHSEKYAAHGIPVLDFCQDNVSFSHHGVLRGLHVQNPNPQGKLVQVLSGEIWDVAVDIREDSATFGKWVAATLSAENHHQLWIPGGFAHGFLVTSDHAIVNYKVAGAYDPASEFTLAWSDPEIGITWPGGVSPILSFKDEAGKSFAEIRDAGLTRF